MSGLKYFSAGAGTIIAQVVNFGCIPLLARIYSPEAFGVWALVQSAALLVGGLATLRYDLAIVVEPELGQAEKLFYATLVLAIGVALAGVFAVFGGVRVISGDFVALQGAGGALLGIWVLLLAIAQVLQSWLLRTGGFGSISFAQIGNVLGTNAVQFGGIHDRGWIWLVAGSVVGQLVALSILWFAIGRLPTRPTWPTAPYVRTAISLLAKYRRFPAYSLPFSVLSIARERIPLLALGFFTSQAAVGMYSQIWRILHVPAGITSSMVRPVLFQRAAADGVASVELTTQIAFRWMLLLGAPWVALGIWSHQELTPMVLGAKWASAAIYVPALIIPAFLFALVNWIDRLLDVARRQDINLFTESAATFTSVGVLGLSLYAGMTPGRAAILQGIVLASAYIGFAFIAFNVLSYSVARLGQSLLGGLLIGLVTISTCVIAAILNFPHAGVAIGGLIFAISMVVVLRLMRVNR